MDAVVVGALDAGAGPIELRHPVISKSSAPPKIRRFFCAWRRRSFRPVDDLFEVDLVGEPPFVDSSAMSSPMEAVQQNTVLAGPPGIRSACPRFPAPGARPWPPAPPPRPEALARGPDSVTHRDLHPVQGGDPGHFVAAGEEMGPVVHVFLGIAEDLALAGGAAGGMEARDLLKGHGPEGEGVPVPQVVPGGEGHPARSASSRMRRGDPAASSWPR